MDNLKSTAAWFVVIIVIGLGGYWAVTTLDADSAKTNNIKEKEVMVAESTPVVEAPIQQPEVIEEKPLVVEDNTKPTTNLKYQSLISEVQKLIDNKIVLQLKSQGASVGTIQKVLNLYNKTTKKVDNDYGGGTKTDVTNFQKSEGVSPQTGQTGPLTYTAMINWLKKQ